MIMSEDKQMKNEYEAFLMNYGKDVSPQEAKQALYDSQIKNMSLGITTIVNSSDKGTILDIGCGKGIILERLNKTETFLKNTGWKYLGIDVEEYEKTLLILAAKLRLHTRVDFVQLKDFQEMDISEESCPLPFFTIIRNVFHKLDINKTSELVSDLSGNVWEWCKDKYKEGSSRRVLRGGGWYDYVRGCRSAYRSP
ncbi:MAG: SUMF1/EgtB/PvdO family nonheme iron enzyme [Candidatus Scalindua sp.]|jgi:SAM-dependent methyltransferase|nr:SUMF1/EgtB/PvdO family nonheme iron enzyme [Candidatus Scalindua sp.]MBT6226352.1 SUMF1/EgtB/PvdO family nonheme iron enzyme [Candidatus Scalindua sp.]MBT6563520.1 SUMF1/EgtB/PvdO family nonheme iron enzyme [Candidatus Scalindua sp.]MBT7212372.1 SUMF1/EgtB/PvdO family nonheme iron enzyme [Candidatus Scalindua sp.]